MIQHFVAFDFRKQVLSSGRWRSASQMYKPTRRKRRDRILIVADDQSVRESLKRLLVIEHLPVETQSGLAAGLGSFYASPPSAILLDIPLSNLSKQHLCEEMKAAAPSIPIIVLSASKSVHDRIALLEKGADDYMTKPYDQRELLARLRGALRRSQLQRQANQITFGDIAVYLEKMEVTRKGRSLALTAHEFKTLRLLLQNADRVITRAELLKEVCGYEHDVVATRCIDNHILKLRQKLEKNPHRPTYFQTVRQIGYKFSGLLWQLGISSIDAVNKERQTVAKRMTAANSRAVHFDPSRRLDVI
jgi:DNA-binding response OmpR family regulator